MVRMSMNKNTKLGRLSRRGRAAFSLIELLLVLVILAILAAVVVTNFAGKSEKARVTAANTDIANLDTCLDAFRVDCGRYPTQEEGLQALVTNPGNVKGWDGPYVKKGLPQDPWGNGYVYRFPGQQNQNGFDLFSMGPDGHEGGTDDVDNWSQK
jgi:general secretion pathway protein G